MKHLLFLSFLLVGFGLTSHSQTGDAWKYAQTITEKGLKDQLSVIASAQMQGRETGTEGQRRAALYIKMQFEKIGLKAPAALDGYQQNYPLFRDSLLRQEFHINKNVLKVEQDFLLIPGSAISETVKSNQLVFAGYGIDDENYSDYKNRNVKGKVVIVMNGEPKNGNTYLVSGTEKSSVWFYSTNRKLAAAQKHGAIAVIFVDPEMTTIPQRIVNMANSNRLYFPRPDAQRVSMVYLSAPKLSDLIGEADAEKVLGLTKNKSAMDKLNITSKKDMEIAFSKKRYTIYASNIIGYIEGSDKKDEYVFLTAHYDHLGMHNGQIYYGADDDGSGTTAVIEMAQAFKKAKDDGHGPRRTIVFMTVSGEEKGLWGSEYYSEHPVFPMDKTTVDLNTDMIGRLDPNRKYGDSTNYVYLIGNDKLSSDLDPISKEVNNKYTHLELDYKYNDPADPERIYYRSDHYNFARKGVPILFYFDGIHADYHKPSDTVDKINFDVMQKRTQYIFLTAWEIANRDEMLRRDIPLPQMTR